MSAALQGTKIITRDQGTRQNILGDNQRVILTGEDTGGSYTLIENYNPPGIGIPMHIHHNEDEVFHVLEGQVEFQIGSEITRAEAGTVIYLPREVPHAFTIVGDAPAKMVVALLPAGLEKYFVELSKLPSNEPPDMEKIADISARYGIEFLPPQ